MPTRPLIACHACDLVQTMPPATGAVLCARCGVMLARREHDSIDRTLALVVTAALLFVLANSFPVVSLEMQGQRTHAVALAAVGQLYRDGEPLVAALALATTFLFPLVQIAGLLAVLLPLHLDRRPRYLVPVLRAVDATQPWSMVEVFMLGVLVTLAKLVHLATVLPGIGMGAFFALVAVLAAAATSLDRRELWARLERQA